MAPLTADWKAAVFGMIKAKLTKAGLRERDAFHFFQAGSEARERDVVTLDDFILAMDQVWGGLFDILLVVEWLGRGCHFEGFNQVGGNGRMFGGAYEVLS